MKPELAPSQLKKTKPKDYLIRFAFGGIITAGTGLIAKLWGPVVAGLFLAFPAILPASLTLVKEHDGRKQASQDAEGACLGSIALFAFAAVVWMMAMRCPPALVLLTGSAVWALAAVLLWFARFSHR